MQRISDPADVQATAVTRGGDLLGEGLHWDAGSGRLLRVDIHSSTLISLDPATGDERTTSFSEQMAFAYPRTGGGLVLGAPGGVAVTDATGGAPRTIAALCDDPDTIRTNDAICDAAGRLWVGTWSPVQGLNDLHGGCALFRVDPDGRATKIVDGCSLSNGLGFSPDDTTLYHVDSAPQQVNAYDFDVASGEISGKRTLVEVPLEAGLPDGLTVDAEGGIWVAMFGGGAVHRYAPDGTLDAVFALPTPWLTSVAFGGPRLDRLYVSSATAPMTDEQRAAAPEAGAVFALDPGVTGVAPYEFGV